MRDNNFFGFGNQPKSFRMRNRSCIANKCAYHGSEYISGESHVILTLSISGKRESKAEEEDIKS